MLTLMRPRSVTGKRPRSRSDDSKLEISSPPGRDARGKRVRRSREGAGDEPHDGGAHSMNELGGLTSAVASNLMASSAQSTRSTSHDLGGFTSISAVSPVPAMLPEDPSQTAIVATGSTQDSPGYVALPIYANAATDMPEESRVGVAGETPVTSVAVNNIGVVRSAQGLCFSFHPLTCL